MSGQTFSFEQSLTSDLVVDAIYEGGRRGDAGDDPLPRLIGVSNSGGFRYRGSLDRLELVALTSSKKDPDWPDFLDRETGIYTYFGDNKKPGRELHGTPRFGNTLLQRVYEDAHAGKEGRSRVPPVLVFASAGSWRDVVFLGLAVPGTPDQNLGEDLVAVWRTRDNLRFQNYRAKLSIIRSPTVSRAWIDSIVAGKPNHSIAPAPWLEWKETGRIVPLLSPRTIQHRRRAEQLPKDDLDRALVTTIQEFFAPNPFGFERCAAELARMMLPNIASLDLTRMYRDGGRDGIGQYRVGDGPSSILVDFALEAKCYSPSKGVGVREVSRLISRLRHRQFGVLVTTSYLDEQAYREIKDDQHPVVIISATDIARLLRDKGFGTVSAVKQWLNREFPSSL